MENDNLLKANNSIKNGVKLILVAVGIILYAMGLKLFVYPANVLPSGFTGCSVLLQKLFYHFFGITLSITVLNVALNIIPAIFSYHIVGKKFTVYSFIILFLFTFLADYIPTFTLTSDPLICAIFGGILCGFGGALWFKCGISGGGTDFIAMSLSTKWHIQTFGYIMAFNIILILIQGILFGWTHAFYSIIYQYVSTVAINSLYRHYEKRTVFVITDKPTLISKMLIKESGHSSTIFSGIGSFTKNEKYLLYTVVTEPELKKVTNIIKKYDHTAFINIIKSDEIQGNFTYLPVDRDAIDENYEIN